MRKKLSFAFGQAAVLVYLSVLSGATSAETVSELTTFTAGTTARASEVNRNFETIRLAVNDNDERVLALEQESVAQPVAVRCQTDSLDSERINQAIQSSSIGSDILILGICNLTETVVLSGNRVYRGGGSFGTVLKQADGANLEALVVTDTFASSEVFTGMPLAIRDLGINGNRDNNTATTDALVIRSFATTVENLWIEEVGGTGIRLTNTSTNGTLLSATSQVNGIIRNNTVQLVNEKGIFIETVDGGNLVTDWNIVDNWVGFTGGEGIHLTNTGGFSIDRNHIYGTGGSAIRAEFVFGSSISLNYIEDFGVGSANGTHVGLEVSLQTEAAPTILGNRIYNFTAVEGPTYEMVRITQLFGEGQLVFSGNVIEAPPSGIGTHIGLSAVGRGADTLEVISSANVLRNLDQASSFENGAAKTQDQL